MRNPVLIIVLLFALGSCTKEFTAEEIIEQTIAAYGGDKVYNSVIEFDFRKKHYVAKYHNYRYELKRIFDDSTGHVVDVLTNDGFTRTVNDSVVALDEKWTSRYANSVNSVIYFVRIPFVLKDPAVIKKLLGTSTIDGKEYYKVEVSFTEEGGGDDFDDRYVYWINKDTFYIDYFAYSYSTSGGGKRFRVAINPREVNGWRVVDYINYKPKDLDVDIAGYDTYFPTGGMEELSRIINENVSIKYLE